MRASPISTPSLRENPEEGKPYVTEVLPRLTVWMFRLWSARVHLSSVSGYDRLDV